MRKPDAAFLTCSMMSFSSVIKSTAPSIKVASLVLIPEYLRSDEKSIIPLMPSIS